VLRVKPLNTKNTKFCTRHTKQVAEAMGTTQAAVARMESGKTMPSARTLARFARATRTRLRISFEPTKSSRRGAK
ncbi:MAG: helix-turn-helix transcriptional regulator, partial [Hyphomicrobiales bacterium]|nr:helix-turn-helix transcriptional regulator [Hyphomicrobiales bacterium]